MDEAPKRPVEIRSIEDIAGGFVDFHQDKLLDACLDTFFSQPYRKQFPTDAELDALSSTAEGVADATAARRVENMRAIEPLCFEFKRRIHEAFRARPRVRQLLMESAKFAIRVHIDDSPRKDSGLPGGAHQLEVALDTLIAMEKSVEKTGNSDLLEPNAVALGLFHDIVEDHARLIMLEKDKIAALLKEVKADGSPRIPADISMTALAIEVIEAESNPDLSEMLRLITNDRPAFMQYWHGLSKEDALALEKNITPDEKNEYYYWYVMNILTDPSFAGESASLVKIKDLAKNTPIGVFRQRYQDLIAKGDPQSQKEAEKLRMLYNRLQAKYYHVLKAVVQLLPSWDPATVIGSQKEELLAEFSSILSTEYQKPIAKA